MKVGDYIRTDNGYICKVLEYTDISDNDFYVNTDSPYNVIYKSWIIKSSPNIIDLIQVGDYVNGEKVIALRKDIDERNIYFNSKDNLIFTDYNISENWYYGIDTDKIKSIVTKEQFEEMQYVVKED